jgi:hypothetical protein
MKTSIKNTSRAPQGVHTVEGLQFIEPGETRTLDVATGYLPRLKKLAFFELGEDIDRPPTEEDIATWSREQLVEATMDGVREELVRASDDDLRKALAAMYSRRDDRDPLDHDGDGKKGGAVPSDREDLKKQAAELGLEYPRNITNEKLKELIDAKLAS